MFFIWAKIPSQGEDSPRDHPVTAADETTTLVVFPFPRVSNREVEKVSTLINLFRNIFFHASTLASN